MTPINGMKRSAWRAWMEGGRTPGPAGPGGSRVSLKKNRSGRRFGARLVRRCQDALQLTIHLGRERVGVRKGEQAVDLCARRLELVVPFREELVVGAAVGELREEHRAG